ncbi:MAG: type II toxin-antitoxin system VapC family toxin [Chitinophagaceae bacterium]
MKHNRLFLDTNVVLDLLGEREPYYKASAQLATLSDQGRITLVVSPITFATVNYFLSKSEDAETARKKLRKFKIISEICKMDEDIIEKGLNSSFKDLEDSLQYFCALDANCEIIISRNAKDFKESLLPVMTAEEYIKGLIAEKK